MESNYIVGALVICLIFSIIAMAMVNNGMHQTVHSIECVAIVCAVIFHIFNEKPYFILYVLFYFSYRTVFRVIGDCISGYQNSKKD